MNPQQDVEFVEFGEGEVSRRVGDRFVIRSSGGDFKRFGVPGINRNNLEYLLPQLLQHGAVDLFEKAVLHYVEVNGVADFSGADFPSLQFNLTVACAPHAAPGELSVTYSFRASDVLVRKYPLGPKAILTLWSGSRLKEVTSVPLPSVLAGFSDLRGTHTVYGHTFCKADGSALFGICADRTEPSYVGQTKQGWYRRWKQHVASAASGSPYRFAEAIRRYGQSAAVFHEVVSIGIGQEEAYDIEEYLVEKFSLYPHGFNMIPGGYAGLQYLSKCGASVRPHEMEDREQVIARLAARCLREGRPNPLAAALWRDDDYAASIICANPNNFSKSRVDEIRYMASLGRTAPEIAASMKCSERRVADLLNGSTCSRVH